MNIQSNERSDRKINGHHLPIVPSLHALRIIYKTKLGKQE